MEYEHPGLIKYRLEMVENSAVTFQILEQNIETITGRIPGSPASHLEYGVGYLTVGSSSYPEIHGQAVWLRGRAKNDDGKVAKHVCGNFTEQTNYYNKVVRSIDMWAELPRWAHLVESRTPKQEQLSLWDD